MLYLVRRLYERDRQSWALLFYFSRCQRADGIDYNSSCRGVTSPGGVGRDDGIHVENADSTKNIYFSIY